jgi:ketosteroid isomerase-like protein
MTDEAEDLRVANERFYRAFEQLDVDAMAAAWSHGEHVKCIHPGWPLLCGWPAVRASWQDIFAGTAEMRFTIGDVNVVAGDTMACVTCTESILAEVHGRVSVTSILATNVFERAPGGWRMILHHASHILTDPAG